MLKACAEGKTVERAGDPCAYFNESLKTIMEGTLEEQELPYRLRAYKDSSPPEREKAFKGIYMEYRGCNKTTINRGYYSIGDKPGMLVVPTNSGDVKIMLEICSRNY